MLTVSDEIKHLGSPSRCAATEVFKANFRGKKQSRSNGFEVVGELGQRIYSSLISSIYGKSFFYSLNKIK